MLDRDNVQEQDTCVRVSTSPHVLGQIAEPDCAAAVWQRDLMPAFQAWIDNLPPEHLPKARVILRPDAVESAMQQSCEIAGTPEGEERDQLVNDMSHLAQHFAKVIKAGWLRLRLDVVDTNACRKFHMDMIRARLVCTYRGTGTQYGVVQGDGDPTRITTIGAGSPMVMRGTLWPTEPDSGLRHRSPPIEGTGEVRLLLVLDPVEGPDAA
ncbi:DUF1826 domain-containing protein [Shimia sp. SDUM112013]|uniref:DUF1826 domain-containing protein n=1 Tax=Shimia sp. SDUM112013 TaxID=3136160 RepID=UPI0032EFAC3E